MGILARLLAWLGRLFAGRSPAIALLGESPAPDHAVVTSAAVEDSTSESHASVPGPSHVTLLGPPAKPVGLSVSEFVSTSEWE